MSSPRGLFVGGMLEMVEPLRGEEAREMGACISDVGESSVRPK